MNNITIYQEAVDHVRERIAEDGAHHLNSCPRPYRAVCDYKRVILKMVEDGAWPEELAT